MGGAVSQFVGNVAKTVAKGATTALGAMIPVVGPALADGVNALYKKGGIVTKRFEAGGVVPAGFQAKPINTASQLVSLIKQFPEEAAKAKLSINDVKEAVAELKMGRSGEAMMARGGMADGGYMMPPPKPSPLNPKRMAMGGMASYSVEPGTPFYSMMSGQRAAARGRGGGLP